MHYARADRFPEADAVLVVDLSNPLRDIPIVDSMLAVVMSHSYPQDRAFIEALLQREVRYVGVLGPRRRTERILSECGLTASDALHSPIGLDIGADAPEEIALAIVSEI